MSKQIIFFLILNLLFFFNPGFSFSQDATAGGKLSGKIVNLSGSVEVQKKSGPEWEKASIGTLLSPGDRVRTGKNGWAALIMADESLIQVGSDSLILFKQISQKAGWFRKISSETKGDGVSESDYIIEKGRLWLRNKNINQQIRIITPFVSTSIRGTELDVDLKDSGLVVISVLEGRVLAENQYGSISIEAMEQAIAEPGLPMKKKILLTPEDSVQWTISIQPVLHQIFMAVQNDGEMNAGWKMLMDGHPDRAIQSFESSGHFSSPYSLLGKSIALCLLRDYPNARALLQEILSNKPGFHPAWAFGSLLSLVSGDRDLALKMSDKALALAPDKAWHHVLKALALQAGFNLKDAMESTRKAIDIDPDYTEGLLNLARLRIADGYPEDALKQVETVLQKEPGNADAWNLKGFILLALKKTTMAVESFSSAVLLDPFLGEPYLGLSLCHIQQGDRPKAFEEIATAVLMEPRRSAFLSYWAKMLYEDKRFQQALDMLDQARQLDPMDPTPFLYRSHILNDLNRLHEAAASMQKAIELNDNQAIYKSRFFLDRDLAVKSVNLALLYKKLGISEWGGERAMTAVKKDYQNYAAHDFLANELEYLHGPSAPETRSADLKSFLLKPANANTFNSFNNYTMLFDQPSLGGTITGYAGNMGYREGTLEVYGALPEYGNAFKLTLEGYSKDGWQGPDWEKSRKINAVFKWDVTHKDMLSFQTELSEYNAGDLSGRTDYGSDPDSQNKGRTELDNINLGYVRHLSADSIVILNAQREIRQEGFRHSHFAGIGTTSISGFPFDYRYDYNSHEWLSDPYTVVQGIHLLKLENHNLSYGAFLYGSDREYRQSGVTNTRFYWPGTGINAFDNQSQTALQSDRPRSSLSIYAQDTWNISDVWTLEGAFYFDHIRNVNSEKDLKWSEDYINPRLGAIFHITPKDQIAFSYIKYLEPFPRVARIDAIDVAGHFLPSFFEGSVIEEKALSYNKEWDWGFFKTKAFVNTPNFKYLTVENNRVVEKEIDQEYKGFETAANILFLKDMSFAAGFTFFGIEKDMVTPLMEGDNRWYWAVLTKSHESGITLSAGLSWYDTDYDSPMATNSEFFLCHGSIAYELPQKKGQIQLKAANLLNKHFNGTVLSDWAAILPQQSYYLMLELNF